MNDYEDDQYQEPVRDRFVPANPEAELAVLGSMLIDPDAIGKVKPILEAEDFYVFKHQWVFTAILDLAEKNLAADFVTVCDELERRHQLEEVGGAAFVMDLINAVPTSIHVESYARKVENHAVLRRLVAAAGRITQVVYETQDADEACLVAIDLVEAASRRRTDKKALSQTETVIKTVEKAEEAARRREEGGKVSISFGLEKLDKATGGMWPDEGDVIVIAAPPGGGKSAFAIEVAARAATAEMPGAIISLEMQDTQLGERFLSPVTGYEAIPIRMGDILDWDTFKEASKKAYNDYLFIDDSSSLTVGAMIAKVKRLHLLHGIRFVVVDYMQLLSAGIRTENRVRELSYIVMAIKAMAKEMRIAVVLVAQLNRDRKSRQDQKPKMTDLDGSSQIEKEASVIIFIYREDLEQETETEAREATMILAKVRQGPKTEFKVGWNGKYGRFSNVPEPMSGSEIEEHRAQLALQCQAMDMTWNSWRLHPVSFENIKERAKIAFHQMPISERNALQPLLNSWDTDRVDVKALEKYREMTSTFGAYKRFGVINEILDTSERMALMQKAKYELMPAIADKRFGLFTGPSGRGKTLLARIVQNMAIREYGLPAVWLNWRYFMRSIKETFEGQGSQKDVWSYSRAPLLILDDPDKIINEFSVQYLYDALDEAMTLSGTPRSVLLILNESPEEFGKELSQFGYLGKAVASRALRRGNPVVMDFANAGTWKDEDAPF